LVGLAKWLCGRMAERWNVEVDTSGGMMECPNGGLTDWLIGGMDVVEWWDRAIVTMMPWWNGGMAHWRKDVMVKWQPGELVKS